MKRIITTIICLLFGYFSNAQSPTSFYWTGIPAHGYPVFTSDYIYYIDNTTYVKSDYQGNVIWRKTGLPRNPHFQGDVFYGIIIGSNTQYVAKCDTAGNYIWIKDISTTVCPLVANHFNSVGGLIVNGDRLYISSAQYTTSSGIDGASALVTMDTSGTVIQSWCDPNIWPMTTSFIWGGYPSFLPGGWIMFRHPGVGSEISLVKINYDGTINTAVPTIEIDMGVSVYLDDILMLYDSTYLAVCRIDNNMIGPLGEIYFGLSRFTENGTVLWQNLYRSHSPDTAVSCSGLAVDSLGNSYVTGTLFDGISRLLFGMKIDPNGNIEFMKTLNDSLFPARLDMYKLGLKDDQLCSGIMYTDFGQEYPGIFVFDTLFSSCTIGGSPYSLNVVPNQVVQLTWQSYSPIAYVVSNDTFSVTNTVLPVKNDLCMVLGVSQDEIFQDLSLYPNPFRSSINIDVYEMGVIKICDLTGHILFENKINGKQEIDLEFLSSGIYQLTFISISKIVSRKIVKL